MFILDLDMSRCHRRPGAECSTEIPISSRGLRAKERYCTWPRFTHTGGGKNVGVHCQDSQRQFFTILESPVYDKEETAKGLAFIRRLPLLDVFRRGGPEQSHHIITVGRPSRGGRRCLLPSLFSCLGIFNNNSARAASHRTFFLLYTTPFNSIKLPGRTACPSRDGR